MSNWSVYMVRCGDGSLYTGIATDVDARVSVHNAGKGAKYTRSRLPVVLVWVESGHDASSARVREAEIKTFSRARKMQLTKRPSSAR